MPPPKKPAKHDTLTGPSTGRTIEVDPHWLSEDPAPAAKPPTKTTIEVDPAWLTEGNAKPPALPRAAKPPPLGAPPRAARQARGRAADPARRSAGRAERAEEAVTLSSQRLSPSPADSAMNATATPLTS